MLYRYMNFRNFGRQNCIYIMHKNDINFIHQYVYMCIGEFRQAPIIHACIFFNRKLNLDIIVMPGI